jgi:general stress protein YciG
MAPSQNPGEGRRSLRGFASMDPQRQRQIASQGGRAAHQQGTAHEFNSEEARAAGRKGGEAVSRNRAHMSEIGRKGGEASGGGRGSRRSHQIDQQATIVPGREEQINRFGPHDGVRQEDVREVQEVAP